MATVGEATIKLNFDGKSLKASAEKEVPQITGALSKIGAIAKTTGKVAAAGIGIGITAAKTLTLEATKAAVKSYGDYEQLAGGMQKIFDQVDFNKISADAQDAFKTMNISANEYMKQISGVGSVFSQTMGDQKGYDTAKAGMQALADYASGTGKSTEELMSKYQAITRSTSSYLSIADQFAGLLPQTTDGFLEQAKAAGYLTGNYTRLNQVPVAEYQEALTKMLGDGVEKMGLANNTANETAKTITGALAGLKSSWQNLITGLADPNANLDQLIGNVINMAENVINNIAPTIEKILPSLGKFISNGLPKLLKTLIATVKKYLPAITKAAVDLFMEIVKALPDILPALVDGLVELVVQLVPYTPAIIGALIEAIIRSIGTLFDRIGALIGPWLSETLTSIGNAIGNWFTGLGNAIGSFFGDFAAKAMEAIDQFAQGFWQAIENIKNWFASIPAFFGNIFKKITGLFKSVGTKIGEVVGGAFKAVINGILGFIEGVINTPVRAINALIDTINAVPGIDLGRLDEFHLPRLARGGVTTGSTIANIGEAGKEAVIPLERNTAEWAGPLAKAIADQFAEQGLGGAAGVTVYMTNNINSNLDADEIGQRLMTSIRRAA